MRLESDATLAAMGFFRWLYRVPGRVERNMEKTALASSVVESEGMGGTHVNPQSMNEALGMLGTRAPDEGEAADEESR